MAHIKRTAWWTEFRSHMTLRVKVAFTENLSVRGFEGKLIIDHKEQKLFVQVSSQPLDFMVSFPKKSPPFRSIRVIQAESDPMPNDGLSFV